jgi:hypothetical protein
VIDAEEQVHSPKHRLLNWLASIFGMHNNKSLRDLGRECRYIEDFLEVRSIETSELQATHTYPFQAVHPLARLAIESSISDDGSYVQ